MNIILFSDVHGNLVALEAFLNATKNFADTYICLGDVVNYGPWNDECLQMIQHLPNLILLEGNHERIFNGKISLDHELSLVRQFSYYSMKYFTKKEAIENLPVSVDVFGYQCSHTIDERSIYPDTDLVVVKSHIIGHSHYQYKIERNGFLVFNSGSIGQNRRWINIANYLVFDTGRHDVELKSLPYNVDLFISELRSRGYPQACIDYYHNKPRLN